MADSVQTIRDLVAGFNTMAMSVGLTPMSGQQQGLAMPLTPAMGLTPAPPPPQLKPPAQAAQEAMQQMEQQISHATRTRQEASWHAGEFADRMKTIQAAYIPITQADAYARILQQPGMGMPGIGQMPITTAPGMNIFRQQQMPGPGFITPPMMPNIPPPSFQNIPMFGGMMQSAMGGLLSPFGGTPPAAQFTDPYERQIMLQQFRSQQRFAQTMANIPEYAGGAATMMGTMGGAMLGGRLMAGGGRLGLLGGAIGALAGGIGGYMAGQNWLAPAAEAGMQAGFTNPLMRTRAFGAQLQDISQGFVVQGPELGPLGRGLSQRAGIQLSNRLQGMVEEGQMGNFNMRDVMRVTGMAANQGMLDMAQNSEQIATQVRNVARGLQNFMRIAQEPDVQRAMQMMSSMRQMGLTIPESQIAMTNARQFARMAGTTTEALMGGPGMMGATTFQRAGLTAGLGLQIGMGAAGFAQQAIAGGGFSPAQLALAGGPQGLAQTVTEASAASLSGQNRFQLLATLSRGAGGALQVDPERLKSIMSGHLSVSQQAAMAAENISRLAMGGRSPEQVLTEFSSRTQELREEMGRRMGPMGGMLLTLRNAMNIQRELGGAIDLGQAIRMAAPGLDANQVRSMQVMAESPGMWRGAQQQILADVPRMRAAESARRQALAEQETGIGAAWRQSWMARAGRAVGGAWGRAAEDFRRAREGFSEWWSGGEGDVDPATGARIVRTPGRLGLNDAGVRRAVMEGRIQDEALQRIVGGITPARPREDFTPGELASGGWGLVRGAAQILGTVKGGAVGGIAASLLPEATTAEGADVTTALRMTGGWDRSFLGRLGAVTPGWMNVVGMAGGDPFHTAMRRLAIQRGMSTAALGQAVRTGVGLTGTDVGALRRGVQENIQQLTGGGEGAKAYEDIEEDAVQAIGREMAENASSWTGQSYKGTTEEMKEVLIKRLVAKGRPRNEAAQIVNTQWPALAPVVMKRLQRGEGGQQAKAVAEQLADQPGFDLQARDLKSVMKRAEKESRTIMQVLGGARYASKWWGGVEVRGQLTDVQQEALGTLAAKQDVSTDELELRMAAQLRAAAAEAGGDDAARLRDQAESIETGVRERLKERTGDNKEFQRLAERVATAPTSGATAEALQVIGKRLGNLTPEARKALLEKLKTTEVGGRQAVAFAKGAARMAEQEGVSISEIYERAKKRGGDYTRKVMAAGEVEGAETRLGGRGRGGEEEAQARGQAGDLADFAAQIPRFREATDKLYDAADKLEGAMRARGLVNTKPGG